jgi:hypothetical protein
MLLLFRPHTVLMIAACSFAAGFLGGGFVACGGLGW